MRVCVGMCMCWANHDGSRITSSASTPVLLTLLAPPWSVGESREAEVEADAAATTSGDDDDDEDVTRRKMARPDRSSDASASSHAGRYAPSAAPTTRSAGLGMHVWRAPRDV